MSEPKTTSWGNPYWEVPAGDPKYPGRVELEEDGRVGLYGIPNPLPSAGVAALVAEAILKAVEYHKERES